MQPTPIQRPTTPLSAIAYARPARHMPATMGVDIFERLAPNQSTRCGVGILNACGISAPRGGFLDNALRDARDGCIFAAVFAVPVALIGPTFSQIAVFTFTFFLVFNCFR